MHLIEAMNVKCKFVTESNVFTILYGITIKEHMWHNEFTHAISTHRTNE